MDFLLKIDATEKNSYKQLGQTIFNHIQKEHIKKQLIILCIGTDKCTGDALGPLVGYKLTEYNLDNFSIYGTLENPIHAQNLISTIDKINLTFSNPFIIAIDASLGALSDVGTISLKNTPLLPGLALNKSLPSIGDISITGVVNLSNDSSFITLTNTRLYTIMLLADSIAKSLLYTDKLLSNSLFSSIDVSRETSP